MENTKIIKRLIQHYIEGSELTQDEHFEVRSLEKQLAAINYTHCCETFYCWDEQALGKDRRCQDECDTCASVRKEK